MGKLIDLTGQQFGRLTVIKRVKNNKHHQIRWLCQCDCGNYVVVVGNSLRQRLTKSCGCLSIESTIKRNTVHGHNNCNYRSKTYTVWDAMIQRCNNSNHPSYKNYGGRGIRVCEAWLKFENFLKDMGESSDKMSIDRINNNGDYCKENCKWSTKKEQERNKRNNKRITINNDTKLLIEWCEQFNLNANTVRSRIYTYKWTPEEALEIIPRKKKNER